MKFMNLKRFGAVAMTGALALSLTAPAFATGTNYTTTITSTYQAITLNVTVPTAAAASINPYGLPVELKNAGGDEVLATISGEQITLGAPQKISNESSVALAVTAEVTGTVDSNSGVVLIADATAVDTANTDGDVLKNVAAKFEAFSAPGIDGNTSADDLSVPFGALKSENAVLTAPVLTDAHTTTGTLVLREGDVSDPDAPVAQDGGVAFIRLSGNVAKKPTTAWATTDKFTATIAFTFEPAEYVGTVTVAGAESVAAGATAKLTVSGLPQGVTVKYDSIKWTSSKETYVTVANGTKAPTTGDTVAENTVTGTVTGVKTSSTKSVITVEFVGSDDITYRGTMEVKCG